MFYVVRHFVQRRLNECSYIHTFKYKKLSNKFLNWLLNHYDVYEVCENYYDSTPKIDDKLYVPYCIYKYNYDYMSLNKKYTKSERRCNI